MTSSLVGSEMCIRDSFAYCPYCGLPAREHGITDATAKHEGPMHGRSPVSYTHLTLPTICSV
eukprot:9227081-Prorocentrum_lima.AAC.1